MWGEVEEEEDTRWEGKMGEGGGKGKEIGKEKERTLPVDFISTGIHPL